MTDLATNTGPFGNSPPELGTIERVIATGDLAKLTAEERARYLFEVCRSLGLNPLTQPFQYLLLNQKLVLYATRGATDQLRRIHHVSTTILSRETVGDVYVVTARATDRSGRSDESIGAVAIGGKRGDDLCNCLMKAESKAKRRATLALVGLGMLDESELETIPDARVLDPDAAPALEPPPGRSAKAQAVIDEMAAAVAAGEEAAAVHGEIEDAAVSVRGSAAHDEAELAETRRLAAAMNPPNERAVREAASGLAAPPAVPGDDVDALGGEALAEACLRMRRVLGARSVPAPAMPKGEANLRVWWHHCAGLLNATRPAR